MSNKGFSYFVSAEQIEVYMQMPIEQKLEWLEEINIFNDMVLGDREKAIQQQFRDGTI